MQNQTIKKNYFFVTISFIAALAGVLFGYDTGVMSGAILYIRQDFQLSPQLDGIVMGAVLFGAMLGALFSGRLTDSYGRKNLLITIAILFILGSVGTAFANSITLLIIGRIIIGLAIGVASYTAPLYISEIAPAQHRGALVSLNQLAIAIGILISYIVDYICAHTGTSWRWMLGLGAVPAICLFIGMIFLPYSPRWLVSKDKIEHALHILRRIRGDHSVAERELKGIQASLALQQNNWTLLFSKSIRPALLIGIGLAVIQQVTGINTILYYAPTIFKMTGFSGNAGAIMASMGIGVIFVLFTIAALPLIDKWGRKILLITGLIGMTIGLAALSFIFHHAEMTNFLKWLAFASMLFYIACFAFSLGPIVWLMIAEIYPLTVRGAGASIATSFNWASNMIVAATFLTLIEFLGTSLTFGLYAVLSILSILFVIVYIPETRSISLEHIEANLYAGRKARDLGK